MSLSLAQVLKQPLPLFEMPLETKKAVETNKCFQVNILSEFSPKEILPPENVVADLRGISGPLDVYFWYEGSMNMPVSGATFMKERILKPLYLGKEDCGLKLYPYSLRAWDFNQKSDRATSENLTNAINRINQLAIEGIHSSSFFEYCQQIQNIGLYDYLSRELPENKSLIELSSWRKKEGLKVDELFGNRSSLFDSIKTYYLNSSYSLMQYVEGYYLIQRSIRNGLKKNLKNIEIAFVLPNDEYKYYKSLPKDIDKMLALDFGDQLQGVNINISFKFFKFGNNLNSRPYIDQDSKEITPEEIPLYFDFVRSLSSKDEESKLEQKNNYLKV